jgi:hypothetical protein
MKKAFLTVGTLAFLASPSLFAVDAVQTQTTLQTQQRLKNGTGMGGKKQYKHLNKHQYEYQGTNGKQQGNANRVGTAQGKGQGNGKGSMSGAGKGQGNMSGSGQGKGQGNMSGMGQGKQGGKGMKGNGGMKGGKGGGGGGKR